VIRHAQIFTEKRFRDGVDTFLGVRLRAGLTLTLPEDDDEQYALGDEVKIGPAPEYEISR